MRYCTSKHQKKHWPAHRAACKLLAAGRVAPPATFADLPAEVLVKIFEHLFPSEYPAAITTRMYPPQLYDPYDAMYRAPAPLLSGAAQAKVYGATGTLPENVVHNTHPVLCKFQPFQLNRATQDVLNAGAACKRWHSVVRDNGVIKHVALAPGLKATTQALALERGNWRIPELSLPRGVQTLLLSGWAQTIVQLPEKGARLLQPCLYEPVWLPLCGLCGAEIARSLRCTRTPERPRRLHPRRARGGAKLRGERTPDGSQHCAPSPARHVACSTPRIGLNTHQTTCLQGRTRT